MKIQVLTYYEPCASSDEGAIEFHDGEYFHQVTKPVTDRYLKDAVRLAKCVNGIPWRKGDGISPTTLYGIKLIQ